MRERVLVVEDDVVVARAVVAVLERLGVEVVHEADGAAAVGALGRGRFGLVVTDVELPGATGLDVLTAVKERSPEVPVLLMTAHAQVEYAIAAVRGRADEFLVKPVDPEELGRTAQRLLDEARARRAARPVVLAVGAHPDDVEIGCGGTLLAHVAAGDHVTILTLSGGEHGGDATLRAAESREAAELLGADLVLCDLPDTAMTEGGPTIDAISEVARRLEPQVVYTHSLNDNHQDHRAVHRATVVAARGIPGLFTYQAPSTSIAFAPGRFVDVTAHIDDKLRVLDAFRSQRAIRAYLAEDLVRATARYWSRFGTGLYAEPLEVLRTSAPISPGEAPRATAAGR